MSDGTLDDKNKKRGDAMKRDEAKIEEAFGLLDQMKKKFEEVESKTPPCIGQCNNDCGTLEPTHRRVTNFYVDNV